MNKTEKAIEKILTTDGRTKLFKEKLRKLGYVKQDTIETRKVLEKVGDFGMMSDGGNKKVARAVAKSKNEKELRKKLEKISTMSGGKYSEAQEDEVIDRAKQDLENLLEGGINTVNIENYGDVPFSNKPAKPITVSAFTKIVSHLESEFDFDFGVQVMRNDAISGLSIAEITGASFIRVNVLTGAV